MTTRTTYGLLDFMGDVGGLNDALFIVSHSILSPYSGFWNVSVILTTLFRSSKHFVKEKNTSVQTSRLKWAFKRTGSVPTMNYLFFCLCCCSRKRVSHRRKLDQAASQIEKELDLSKFIERQRLHSTALAALLSARQSFCPSKMS